VTDTLSRGFFYLHDHALKIYLQNEIECIKFAQTLNTKYYNKMRIATFMILLIAIFAVSESCERQDTKVYKLTDAITEAVTDNDATDYEYAQKLSDRLYEDAAELTPTNAVILTNTYIILYNYHIKNKLKAKAREDCRKAVATFDIASKNDGVTTNKLCQRYFLENNIPATIEQFRKMKSANADLQNH
jgi:hypothetical protein